MALGVARRWGVRESDSHTFLRIESFGFEGQSSYGTDHSRLKCAQSMEVSASYKQRNPVPN